MADWMGMAYCQLSVYCLSYFSQTCNKIEMSHNRKALNYHISHILLNSIHHSVWVKIGFSLNGRERLFYSFSIYWLYANLKSGILSNSKSEIRACIISSFNAEYMRDMTICIWLRFCRQRVYVYFRPWESLLKMPLKILSNVDCFDDAFIVCEIYKFKLKLQMICTSQLNQLRHRKQ